MALAFEKCEINVMERPPQDPAAPILSKYFIFRIIFVSIIIGAMTLFVFMQLKSENLVQARTTAVNTIIFSELFYLFNCRKINESIFSRDFFANKIASVVSLILVAIQIAFKYLPFMNTLFGTAPVKLINWLYPLGVGLIVMLVVEAEKKITLKYRKNK